MSAHVAPAGRPCPRASPASRTRVTPSVSRAAPQARGKSRSALSGVTEQNTNSRPSRTGSRRDRSLARSVSPGIERSFPPDGTLLLAGCRKPPCEPKDKQEEWDAQNNGAGEGGP